MISTVHLDPAALSDLADLDPDLARMIGDRVVREMLAFGELELSSEDAMVELIRLTRQGLPGLGGQQWQEVLVSLRRHGRVRFGSVDVRPRLNLTLRIAEERADGDPHVLDRDIEVASVRGYPQSTIMRERSDLAAQGHLPQGSSRQQFWSAVIGPLAERSKRVTIVDRYMFTGLETAPAVQRHALLWILDKLGRAPGPELHVHLVGASVDRGPGSSTEVAQLIEPRLRFDGRLSSVEVTMAGPKAVSHDRHITFSCGAGVILPAGLDRLRTPEVLPNEGMNWIYRNLLQLGPLRDAEIAAERAGVSVVLKDPSQTTDRRSLP